MNVAAFLNPAVEAAAVEAFRGKGITFNAGFPPFIKTDAAMVFGGDGTIHRFLPQLRAFQVPVLVVPRGSGNDFARTLGIQNEAVALRAWKEFCGGRKNVRRIDLGLIRSGRQEILFCCVAGAGLDADANARANNMPAWLRRWGGYFLAVLQALVAARRVELQIGTEGAQAGEMAPSEMAPSTVSTALLIAVGNAHRYGGGIKIVPEAALDDGLLDVCVVGEISKLKVLFCLPIIYFGGHTGLKEVQYFLTKTIRIESSPPLDFYADGEFACRTPVEISLLPQALDVIVPA
jgi:diacylglycerol kinase (ATP)